MSRKYPIIRFDKRNQDNAKTPGGGSRDKPKFTLSGEDLVKRRDILLGQLEEVLSNWKEDIIDDAPKILEIKYIDEAKAKSHQSKIVEIFKNYKRTTQIGARPNNGIIVQLSSVNQLNETINSFQSFDENDVVISAIESIHKYEPSVLNSDNNEYNLTFWDFMDDKKNKKVIEEVESSLISRGIEYKKESFGGGEPVFEVSEVTKDKLEFIKKLPIKQIEPTEKTEPPFHDIESASFDLPKVEYNPDLTYPLIGLLDSGIEINDYTSDWVTKGAGCAYSENELDKSHGTYIASLLIHGDQFNNTSDFSLKGCRIVDVPIVPQCSIDSKLLISNIETAIKSNLEVKIWNLSIGLGGEIEAQSFSNFAKELDRIQEENHVLIFKSAGNDASFFTGGQPGKLNNGADSIRSVTVGSVNRRTDTYEITKEGHPSPYSRIGKGPSYIIKPELVHFGGDLFALNDSPKSKQDYESVDGIGISVGQKKMQQPGTSFSTPKVAKIAAEVKNFLKTDDLLMIKALLVHSANHSPLTDLNEDETTQKMGFGRPMSSEDIASEPNQHSITLMLRGKLDKGKEIDIMDFPFPQTLIENNKYNGRLIVTLVSNPYLRGDLATEYCQTNLDVKFGTYDKKEDVEGKRAIFNAIKRSDSKNVLLKSLYSKKMIKTNSDYNYERTLIEYGDKYYPVKKYACDLSEFTGANQKYLDSTRKWYIHLKGEYRDYITKENERERSEYVTEQIDREFEELGIDYCMLVSIYDPSKEKNIYDSVINELDILGFNYEQVSIENEVTIESDTSADI